MPRTNPTSPNILIHVTDDCNPGHSHDGDASLNSRNNSSHVSYDFLTSVADTRVTTVQRTLTMTVVGVVSPPRTHTGTHRHTHTYNVRHGCRTQ